VLVDGSIRPLSEANLKKGRATKPLAAAGGLGGAECRGRRATKPLAAGRRSIQGP